MDLTHHFLLSMPGLDNSWFDRTISYIFKHDDEGALGFVINRPASINAGEIYDQLQISCIDPVGRANSVLEGGPIDTERGFVLYSGDNSNHKNQTHSCNSEQGIYLSSSTEMLTNIGAGDRPENYLLLLGYAGWSAGQLETEVANNIWLTCEAEPDILFTQDPDKKLNMAARSLGIDFSMLSTDTGHA